MKEGKCVDFCIHYRKNENLCVKHKKHVHPLHPERWMRICYERKGGEK
jgi:hypothetical protein